MAEAQKIWANVAPKQGNQLGGNEVFRGQCALICFFPGAYVALPASTINLRASNIDSNKITVKTTVLL